MKKPILLLMCGLSFAGKTTLARALVITYGWHFISLDGVNTERGFGLGGKAISPDEWEQSYTEAYRRVETALQAGYTVVYDETNFLRAQRDALRAIAARSHAITYVVYVATPEAEARRRRASWRPIGLTSLFNIDFWSGTAEYGIVIGEKACWGKGYGTAEFMLIATGQQDAETPR